MTGSSAKLWLRLRSGLTNWPTRILPSVIIIAVVVAARGLGWLQSLEWKALDYFLRVRPAEITDEHIVIVGITEADIQRIGAYPIPDGHLADLLQMIQATNPRVIGLDIYRDLPVEPGHEDFNATLQRVNTMIAIEKLLPPSVGGPEVLPQERIGFADLVVDRDGFVRRSLLGATYPAEDFHFAFTLRLVEAYLAQENIPLENGIRDPVAMRFDTIELAPLAPNAGGYVGADMGGHQILVNFRSGATPFRILTWSQIQAGQFDPKWLHDRIVLIGVTAPSVKDFVNSAAISSPNPGLVFGIEFQAHAVSQIVNAVLEDRPLLRSWPEGWDYAWIVLWGGLGIGLGRMARKPWQQVLLVVSGSSMLLAVGYGLLLWQGWWIPIVPTLAVFVTNGVVFPLFYWYGEELRARIQERQLVIDNTFNAIHNGPLQNLAQILHDTYNSPQVPPALYGRLQGLNQELRDIYTLVRQEALTEDPRFYLSHQRVVDLNIPLHQLLYEVYDQTLRQDLPGFLQLKAKIIEFDPMAARKLTLEDKRDLCRFLQEALQNVGKHAVGATRLAITCKQVGRHNMIRVADNGQGSLRADKVLKSPGQGGHGTQHAYLLSKRLGGHFSRYLNTPRGMVCELTWPAHRTINWPF
ncbi:MAG: CHASE2 domain-containing protein [Nodosilinea sp.]